MPSKDFRMNPAVMSDIQAAVRKVRQAVDDFTEACLKIEKLNPANTTFEDFDAAGKRFHEALQPIAPSIAAIDELATKLEAKYN